MPKARVNDIELYYEVHGQGYPVVFMHGFTGTVKRWQPQLEALSREYQFIIFDARGHGQSETPLSEEQYSADIFVEDILQLLVTLGIEKAVVGGLSLGGYESLRFYLHHPQMVAALIIIDAGPGYRNPARREEWNLQPEQSARLLETQGIEAFAASYGYPDYELLLQPPIGLAHTARKCIAQHDSLVIDSLGEIKVPTLVVVGEKDTTFIRGSEYMAEVIPGAQYVVIPGADHIANRDNAEFFNKTILDFLRQLNLAGTQTLRGSEQTK